VKGPAVTPQDQEQLSGGGDRHAEILDRLLTWATDEPNVRAVIQTGSSSRTDGTVDRFSDRDIELICRNPQSLAGNDGWIHAIAPVDVALYLQNGPEEYETRLVFFHGMRKVDFTLASINRVESMKAAGHLDRLYTRGYRVLLDKDDLASGLPVAASTVPGRSRPTEAEFQATVNEFWFEAAHMPTYLTRNDLWTVKLRDATMKEMLLRLLEWHALLQSGQTPDVWHRGTKMQQWVSADTWAALHDCFGHFDRVDSYRAIRSTMDFFAEITHEVAAAAGFAIPGVESTVGDYVRGLAPEFAS
jgi:aminoglycoside 6-adenylyltransferase